MNTQRKTGSMMLALLGAALGLLLLLRRLMQRTYDLGGKVVVISGGSRGLGLALADAFARQGAKLAICARNTEALERARQELSGRGAEVLALPCDITDHEQVQQFIHSVTEHYGRIDVLVNVAGIMTLGPVRVQTYKDFEDSMNIMFWGAFHTIMVVLPQMIDRKDGHIVNITSIGGKISVPHLLPYSAAKFALVGFSEGLHAELAKYGIHVLTVVPGLMRTGSHLNITTKGQHQAEYTWFSLLATSPLTSTSVERAVKQIVRATQRGDSLLVITWQAKFALLLHGLFPGIVSSLSTLANRFLPRAEGTEGFESKPGKESQTPLTQSFLTALGQKAAEMYNE